LITYIYTLLTLSIYLNYCSFFCMQLYWRWT